MVLHGDMNKERNVLCCSGDLINRKVLSCCSGNINNVCFCGICMNRELLYVVMVT